MIRVDINEQFPITAMIVDEVNGQIVTGATVNYNVCDETETIVASGILTESTTASGVYTNITSLDTAGIYRAYATSVGYNVGSEDIKVNSENIYDLTKHNLPYNTSVVDVQRTTASGSVTASQLARNVPLNKTDYIVTLIKNDGDLNWDSPVSSGISYAHYTSTAADLPFTMGGPY